MAKTMRVLSIDGGGIRGVIPATVLAELEQQTRQPVASMFDLVAGTSTGGILALGVTCPGDGGRPRYSAADLLTLYEEQGSRIFQRSAWHRFIALENLLEEKFPSKGVQDVLHEYFGDAELKDVLTNVLVTSYEIEQRFPFLFKSHRAKDDPTYNFLIRDVARATSAAPTYFEPAQIKSPAATDQWSLIDGGVFANNPALCGYVEARALFPDVKDVLVVSLGTGELTRPIPYEEARTWGLARWAQPILGVVFDGVSDTIDYELEQLCPKGDDDVPRYYRFQSELTEGNDDMDDASRANISALKRQAEKMLQEKADELELLVRQLADGREMHLEK